MKEKIYDNSIKGLAMVGMGALLAFVIWGASIMLNTASPFFANINSAALTVKSQLFPEERISLSFPKANVESGEIFKGFYSYNGSENLRFSYDCKKDVNLSIKLAEESYFFQLNCNSRLFLDPQNSEFSLKASNTGTTSESVKITLETSKEEVGAQKNILINSEEEEATQQGAGDSQNTHTENESEPAKDNNTTQEQKEIAGEREDTVYPLEENNSHSGEQRPDLTGEIIEMGQGSPASNDNRCDFVSTSTKIKQGNQAAVRFSIENSGNTETGKWEFDLIPTYSRWEETSVDNQKSLAPGDRIEYTTCFKTAFNKEKSFIVNIDPENKVKEIDEDNNILKKEITYTKDND